MFKKPKELTPQQIAQACAAIRATWSESERQRRLAIANPAWRPPMLRPKDIGQVGPSRRGDD